MLHANLRTFKQQSLLELGKFGSCGFAVEIVKLGNMRSEEKLQLKN